MKDNREELDRILEEMAEETPEMPADFHARWTEKIHEEQQTEPHREQKRQIRYILSAAALFVFLIGGTLITRTWEKRNQAVSVPAAQDKVMYSVEANGTAAKANTLQAEKETEEEAEEAADMAVPMAAMEEAAAYETDTAAWEDAAYEAAEEPAMEAAAAPKNAAEVTEKRVAAEEPAEAAGMAGAALTGNAARTETEETEEAAAAGTDEEEPARATAVPTEAPTAAPTAAPKQENGFISFMRDFARFTLKTLAVLGVIAVVAAAVILARRNMNKTGRK